MRAQVKTYLYEFIPINVPLYSFSVFSDNDYGDDNDDDDRTNNIYSFVAVDKVKFIPINVPLYSFSGEYGVSEN